MTTRRHLRLRADRAQSLSPAARARRHADRRDQRPRRAGGPRLPAALRHAARPLHRGRRRRGRASSTSAARRIPLLTGKDQPAVPRWGELGVHTVLEATSRGRTRAEVEAHLAAGARRVILLAPPLETPDITVVMGVNDARPRARAPHRLQRLLDRALPHARPRDPRGRVRHPARDLHDHPLVHERPPAGRRAGRGQAPRPRGRREHHPAGVPFARDGARPAARARRQAHGLRDERPRVQRLGRGPRRAGTRSPSRPPRSTRPSAPPPATRRWKGILDYEDAPIVSSDVARSRFSATFDSLATMTLGENVSKTLSWFDSGYGYAHRAVDLVERFAALEKAMTRGARRDQRVRPHRPQRLPHPLGPRRTSRSPSINDLFDNDHLAYLLKYDTVMRVFPKDVTTDAESMTVAGRRVAMTSEKDPAKIPWGEHRRGRRGRGDRAAADPRAAREAPGRGRPQGDPDGARQGRDRRDDRDGRQRRHALAPSTASSRTPRARRTAWRRSRRSSTRASASRRAS